MNNSEIAHVERALRDADRLIDTLDPSEVYVLFGIKVAEIRGQILLAMNILRRHQNLPELAEPESDA